MIRNRMHWFLVTATVVVGACHRESDSCATLDRELQLPGESRHNQTYCAEALSRLRTISKPWGSIKNWRETVYAQGPSIFAEVQQQVIEAPATTPAAFDWYPSRTPCGDGVAIDRAAWDASPLGGLNVAYRPKLYFSFAVVHDGQRDANDAVFLAFRMRQNLDCDASIGTVESAGYARLGHRLIDDGTWSQMAFSSPQFMTE
jgi:hypothetical protein